MEHYAHTALMEMLTSTVTGPDLAVVLGPLSGQGPVLDALIEGLGPVVSRLLQVTLGLGGRAAAGTVSLGQAEEELRTSGRDLMRATLQAVVRPPRTMWSATTPDGRCPPPTTATRW